MCNKYYQTGYRGFVKGTPTKVPRFDDSQLVHNTDCHAPGATVATFCGESTLDDLARELGYDPMDFRIKNASKEGDSNVDDDVYTRIGIVEMLETVKASDEYNRPIKKSENGWPVGRGVGIGWWPCGIEISSARVMVNHDGGVDVATGAVDLHGVRTGTAQVAAETKFECRGTGIFPSNTMQR